MVDLEAKEGWRLESEHVQLLKEIYAEDTHEVLDCLHDNPLHAPNSASAYHHRQRCKLAILLLQAREDGGRSPVLDWMINNEARSIDCLSIDYP